VEAAQDETVAGGIDEGQREALIPARVLERVVADEADALDRTSSVGFEDR